MRKYNIFNFLLWATVLLHIGLVNAKNMNCLSGKDNQSVASEILGRPTDKSVTISVMTNYTLEVYYEYGTEPGIYRSQTGIFQCPSQVPVKVVVNDLQGNTRYYYRMRYREPGTIEFATGPEHTFHTQRQRGRSFRFAIQADSHLYDKKCTPALYQLTQQNVLADAPDFLIDLGDTFGNDHDTTWSRNEVFQLYLDQRYFFENICHSVPLFLCLGNHELEYSTFFDGTAENLAVYATQARQYYYLNPFPNDFYSGNTTVEDFVSFPENYYAWEWGNALFVVLDAYRYLTTSRKPRNWDWTLGDKQYHWFKKALEESDATFKFVFIHHVLGQTRGALQWADKFEWGGHNQKGNWEFDVYRPTWEKPVHQLMVDNGVTILFQGHDHLFSKEELDGIVYQECPMPSDATYNVGSVNEDDYPTGIILKNSGHLLVTVADTAVKVDYIRAFLPQDETADQVNAKSAYSYTINKVKTSVTGSMDRNTSPPAFNLEQNYPNPFNPSTAISFQIPNNEFVKLHIYNMEGQFINTLLESYIKAGDYTVSWDGVDYNGRQVSSGIYFYELKTAQYRKIRKAFLIR